MCLLLQQIGYLFTSTRCYLANICLIRCCVRMRVSDFDVIDIKTLHKDMLRQ